LDRKKKEEIIRDNMERGIARSQKQWRANFHEEMPKERKEYEKEEFKKAANRVDKGKLHEMWNDKV